MSRHVSIVINDLTEKKEKASSERTVALTGGTRSLCVSTSSLPFFYFTVSRLHYFSDEMRKNGTMEHGTWNMELSRTTIATTNNYLHLVNILEYDEQQMNVLHAKLKIP